MAENTKKPETTPETKQETSKKHPGVEIKFQSGIVYRDNAK